MSRVTYHDGVPTPWPRLSGVLRKLFEQDPFGDVAPRGFDFGDGDEAHADLAQDLADWMAANGETTWSHAVAVRARRILKIDVRGDAPEGTLFAHLHGQAVALKAMHAAFSLCEGNPVDVPAHERADLAEHLERAWRMRPLVDVLRAPWPDAPSEAVPGRIGFAYRWLAPLPGARTGRDLRVGRGTATLREVAAEDARVVLRLGTRSERLEVRRHDGRLYRPVLLPGWRRPCDLATFAAYAAAGHAWADNPFVTGQVAATVALGLGCCGGDACHPSTEAEARASGEAMSDALARAGDLLVVDGVVHRETKAPTMVIQVTRPDPRSGRGTREVRLSADLAWRFADGLASYGPQVTTGLGHLRKVMTWPEVGGGLGDAAALRGRAATAASSWDGYPVGDWTEAQALLDAWTERQTRHEQCYGVRMDDHMAIDVLDRSAFPATGTATADAIAAFLVRSGDAPDDPTAHAARDLLRGLTDGRPRAEVEAEVEARRPGSLVTGERTLRHEAMIEALAVTACTYEAPEPDPDDLDDGVVDFAP